MSLEKLDAVYDEILGKTGESIATAEPEPDKGPAPKDNAYDPPDYSGEEAGDDDGVDPRDPSTFPKDKGEPDEDDSGEEPEGSEEETEEYDDIPDELVAAGRLAGFTDEEIIDLDADNPAVLEALAKAYKQADGPPAAKEAPQEPAQKPGKEPDPEPESLELEFDLPGLDDELSRVAGPVQEAFGKLVNRLSDLESRMGETQNTMASVEKSRQADGIRQIDTFFDSAAKQTPELGNSENLTDSQKEARIHAWRIAKAVSNDSAGEMSIEEALKVGVNALRGQISETKIKARLVSDLNKRKSKFSPRPRGSRRSPKPKTEEERGIAAIDEVLDDPKYK